MVSIPVMRRMRELEGFHSWNARVSWGRGIFGALSRYYCDKCGPIWHEPETSCLSRGGWYEPPDYAWRCPGCDKIEVVGERLVSDPRPPFTVNNRRRVPVALRPNRAER